MVSPSELLWVVRQLFGSQSKLKLQVTRSPRSRKVVNEKLPLTVLLVSYQAEKTIAQALRSILEQETSFRFEILIYDDASSDGTMDLLQSHLASSNALWTLLTPDRNLYSRGLSPVRVALDYVNADLVARLDGDDYWIEPGKLQRQHDLLVDNPKSPVVCTSWQIVDERDVVVETPIIPGLGSHVPYSELVRSNFICNSSAVFRTRAARKVPRSIQNITVRDYAMWGYMICGSDVLVDRTLSTTYRRHESSAFSSRPLKERVQEEIVCLKWLSENVKSAEIAELWRRRTQVGEEWLGTAVGLDCCRFG